MRTVVCFGEIMLRLTPPGYLRLLQTDGFTATYAGGEANVAVSLANYGVPVTYVTKVPTNELGQSAVNALRRYGVGTGFIARGGKRLGVYFVEKGASQRASKVVYDRAGSAIAEAGEADFDWNAIFDNAGWFHFTGITPALSENTAKLCREACKAAKARGITVSCDINYRKNLWSRQQACEVMSGLMEYVDVCIANEEDAADVFAIKAQDTDITGGRLSHDGYREVAEKLAARFAFSTVAITLRGSVSASDNNWGAMVYDGKDCYISKNYPVHIVDRVGGGDSFGGGLIYAMLQGMNPQEAVEFAAAASCLKHSIEGDFNLVSVDEVKRLAQGDASGRVQR